MFAQARRLPGVVDRRMWGMYSVTEFGSPSGSDWTSVFQAAAASGEPLVVPPGTYSIDDTIDLSATPAFLGFGTASLIQTDQEIDMFVYQSASDFEFSGVKLTGAATASGIAGYGAGVLLLAASRGTIDGVTASNLHYAVQLAGHHSQYNGGVSLDSGARDVTVTRLRASDVYMGVFAINDIQYCTFADVWVRDAVGPGFYSDDSHSTSGETVRENYHNTWERCRAIDCGGGGMIFAGTSHSRIVFPDVRDSGQTADATVSGIAFQAGQNGRPCKYNQVLGGSVYRSRNDGINLTGSSHNQIIGMQLIDNGYNRPTGSAQSVELLSQTVGEATYYSTANVIHNNVMRSDDASSVINAHVLIATGNDNNTVRGNQFYGNTAAAVADNSSTASSTDNQEL